MNAKQIFIKVWKTGNHDGETNLNFEVIKAAI